MYMESEPLEVKVTGCAGTLLINRPEHGNTLTRLLMRQMGDALDDLYREKRVRAIILSGTGDAFCTGCDLRELVDDDSGDAQHKWGSDAAGYRDLLLKMLEIPKPIIASVHGPALSDGAGLVVASDIVVASTEATFGLPDPRQGLVAGVVAPLLCARLGTGQAARLLLTSETIEANEGHRLGLFHELSAPENVWARAMEIAQQCALGAHEAVQLTKRLLHETAGEQLATQLSAGAIMRATSCTTESGQEGIAAFLENRSPNWQ